MQMKRIWPTKRKKASKTSASSSISPALTSRISLPTGSKSTMITMQSRRKPCVTISSTLVSVFISRAAVWLRLLRKTSCSSVTTKRLTLLIDGTSDRIA